MVVARQSHVVFAKARLEPKNPFSRLTFNEQRAGNTFVSLLSTYVWSQTLSLGWTSE